MAWYQRLSRGTRLAAVGGLAVGVGFGAMLAVNAATSGSPSSGPADNLAAAAGPGAPDGAGAHFGGRHGKHHGVGVGGTITAIRGGTLTLRTEPGTATVNTDGSTRYTKEHQSIQFSDLHVGDQIHAASAPGTARPSDPANVTFTAARVMVIEPRLAGRVTGIDGDTVNLVGRNGQLLTVTLTGSTRYYRGNQAADRSAVTTGSHIAAEGSQDSLTHLTADEVTVLPARPDRVPGAGPGAGLRDFGGAPPPDLPADLPGDPGLGDGPAI